ncbi:MAG TPA: 2-oxo acid dehydrogenase subunit E2 [Streptosporangiaceae bacterium]|nr:2-oxo acid dehydrogenase subunit E2 [Streptosporangiaceae bacterium]
MSVSVQMPQLGESVTEGTVTRWLKKEGERVEADEPLLEVSTDKVDTEIPSPVAGILRGITVAEDETVEVGAELAVIDEDGAEPSQPAAPAAEPAPAPSAAEPSAAAQAEAPVTEPAAPPPPEPAQEQPAAAPQAPAEQPQQAPDQYATQQYQQQPGYQPQYQPGYPSPPTYPPQAYISPETYPQQAGQEPTQQGYAGTYQQPGYEQPSYPPQAAPAEQAPPAQPAPPAASAAPPAPAQEAPAAPAPEQAPGPEAPAGPAEDAGQVLQPTAEGPYVTPLVRKLASEHGIDLATVTGTGVGGRIRKQDVLDAARSGRGTAPAPAPAAAAPPQQAAPAAPAPAEVPSLATPTAPATAAPATAAPATTAPATTGPAAADGAPATNGRSVIVPSRLRGTTEQMSRARQVIAKRMVESLHVSAQLTTVVEADVTEIARLRDRAKAAFAAREGVKLSFLPFFALATVEALKIHPKLNAVIDTESNQVTYHDAEHLGIAVDTERGLMVPVIRKAGDLNIGGLARKIADLADRTRAGRVSPDDLSGGTFTLTNTGSRGALFDTPIINQPQVGILGTGTVVKRPVVVEDPALGEVITVRSMVYLALTYDHRLVDGADAARFLVTVKDRLEEGDFAAELGL